MSSYTITQKSSPNHFNGRNGWKPDMICNHICEGYYQSSIDLLCNPARKAASTFVVAWDGRICQLVDLTDGAWCNGTSTVPSSNVYYGKSSLPIVRDRKTNANYYTVSIEHEGFSGKPMPEAQYQATLWLHKFIISEVKRLYKIDIPIDREHIVGHYQIDPIPKPNCPGTGFPWDRLINDLKISQFDANTFVGKYLVCKADTTLYSTAGYSGSTTSLLKAGTVVYCAAIHTKNGAYVALQNPDTKEYFLPAAWTKDFKNFEITTYNPVIKIEVDSLTITNISTEIEVGNTMELNVIIKPDNCTEKVLTFFSSDDTIATVDNKGVINAVKEGMAKITVVSSNNKSVSIDLKIYKEEVIIIPEPPTEEPVPVEPEKPQDNKNQFENMFKSVIQMMVQIFIDFIKEIFNKK